MARIYKEPKQRIAPGPRGRLLLGNMRHIKRHPLEFYASLRSQYGDVVRFRTTGRFVRARRELDEAIYRLVAERRRSGKDVGDLLSMLLAARDEQTGESISDQQLRDEVMTILVAGYETTASALAWTWYLLGRHPEAEAKLHAEMTSVLAGRAPTAQDLPKLCYARMVLQEAMRLYPPAWSLLRQVREDDEIRGYRVPARATVVMSQYVTH